MMSSASDAVAVVRWTKPQHPDNWDPVVVPLSNAHGKK